MFCCFVAIANACLHNNTAHTHTVQYEAIFRPNIPKKCFSNLPNHFHRLVREYLWMRRPLATENRENTYELNERDNEIFFRVVSVTMIALLQKSPLKGPAATAGASALFRNHLSTKWWKGRAGKNDRDRKIESASLIERICGRIYICPFGD